MIGPASLAAVVCGAWFGALPPGWHQKGPTATVIANGVATSNTFSWAATPRSVWDLTKPLPRDGIYIWVDLVRPERDVSGASLQLPLRLRDAWIIEQKGAVRGLPEYRFEGRVDQQYHAIIGVDFGRRTPTTILLGRAERVLRGLVLPRWVPPPRRHACGP